MVQWTSHGVTLAVQESNEFINIPEKEVSCGGSSSSQCNPSCGGGWGGLW